MGAEGKYDLKLAPGYDSEAVVAGAAGAQCKIPVKTKGKSGESSSSGKSSLLTSTKCSSMSSLPEATDVLNSQPSVASTDQASSDDCLLVNKVSHSRHAKYATVLILESN
jgi:E3 ubiquitin-protein ligase HECTD1